MIQLCWLKLLGLLFHGYFVERLVRVSVAFDGPLGRLLTIGRFSIIVITVLI